MRRVVPIITLAILGAATITGCTVLDFSGQITVNEAHVMRFYEEFWNEGDADVLEELFTVPGYVHKEIGMQDFAPETYEELEARFEAARTATPDIHYIIKRIFSEDNEVIVQWIATGTHTGDLEGLPATGNNITYYGVTIWVIEDGKIIESFTEDDDEDLNEQFVA